MAKAEQQALTFFSNKQDAELASHLHAQPSSADAAHLSLDKLAQARMPTAYVALLQSELASQQTEPATALDSSPALAIHELVDSMSDKDATFVSEVVAAMHAAGLSLSLANSDKDTPLHLAARSGHLQLCQLLTNNGADPLARNSKNRCEQLESLSCHLPPVSLPYINKYAGHLADRPSLLLM